MTIPTVNYVDEINDDTLRHILLGNGFSRALNSDLFSFKTLFEKAGFDAELVQFLKQDNDGNEGLGTYPDFEKTLKTLRDASLVLRHLGFRTPDRLNELQENIRDGLTKAVHAVHEVKAADGSLERYITQFSYADVFGCANFLKAFQRDESIIFTVNYDLLLYRVLMEIKNPNNQLEEDGLTDALQQNEISLARWGDAFIHGKWEKWSTPAPRVCFLHGALHIFSEGSETYKLIAEADNLINTISASLDNGKTPLVVCEGTANRKRAKIFGNDYLRDCYSRLGKISGKLFILGCSLAENDGHIWEAVNANSQISKVLVGYFGNTELNSIRDAARKYFPQKVSDNRVLLFDTSGLHIWG